METSGGFCCSVDVRDHPYPLYKRSTTARNGAEHSGEFGLQPWALVWFYSGIFSGHAVSISVGCCMEMWRVDCIQMDLECSVYLSYQMVACQYLSYLGHFLKRCVDILVDGTDESRAGWSFVGRCKS